MFVVVVEFEVKTGHEGEFRSAILQQASNSLYAEADCLQFDVCVNSEKPGEFFLYEVYTDEAAFQMHIQTPHFIDFNTKVGDWVASKSIRSLERIED